MNKEILEGLLKDTNGEIIYNEQLVDIMVKTGFTLEESDFIRKAYGKRNIEDIKKWEQLLLDKVGLETMELIVENVRRNASKMVYKSHTI